MKKIFIVCGEDSGEFLATLLVKSLRKINNQLEIKGLGGRRLEGEGVQILYNLVEKSVIGIWEVLMNLSYFKKVFRDTINFLKDYRPHCLILIDYPGFNLRLAKVAKKLGIKIIYYVSPQVWAWNRKRIKVIKENVDLMLVIFPFEERFYKKYGVNTEFVGWPRREFIKPEISCDEFRKKYCLNKRYPLIGLLPGSRYLEVANNLGVMLESIERLKKDFPQLQGIIIKSPILDKSRIQEIALRQGKRGIKIIDEFRYSAIKTSDFLIVCSGTATVEVGLLKKPFLIIYRLSPFNYALLRFLIKIPYIGMINILLEEETIPELIQYRANPKNISRIVKDYLDNPQKIKILEEKFNRLDKILKGENASFRAAQIIWREISEGERS